MGLLDGKVAVITGAGRGIGRIEAFLLASEGASVVVNDVGAAVSGEASEERPAEEVVNEIKGAGGTAVANFDDITSWEGGQALINQATQDLGGLDIRVNNAGIMRDRMSFTQEAADWHAVSKATSDKPWTIDSIEGVRDQLFKGVDGGVPPFTL